MDVSIPIAKVIVADTSGNRLNGGAAVDTELFSMNQLSKKWVLMYKKKNRTIRWYIHISTMKCSQLAKRRILYLRA